MTDLRRAPDFLFENLGSHGDVMPLLGIAAELVRRGHRCQLLANEHFRAEAGARGVGFHAISSKRTHDEQGTGIVACMYSAFDVVRDYFRAPNAFDERTVVVDTHSLSSCEPLAEAHGLRTVRLNLFPIRIKSLIAPPWPLGARAEGPGGEHFLKVTLPAMYRAADTHPAVLAKMNEVRAQVGLAPVGSASYERSHIVKEAAMFPDWYGMPAKDWPDLECLGFPLPPSGAPLPARVLEFLARNPRPAVFTTGTGFGKPEQFFQAAAECCAELKMPGIFLSRFLAVEPRALGEHIAHFEHVELDALLEHAGLIVHHGGMGTTARALQAGSPQVISPITFDQPDNGHRVEVLGAGRVVPRERMSGATFAAAVRELLGDAELSSRLSRYCALLASPSAVERAADLLENVARSTLPSSQAASACSACA
jgi:UDP:flavonoid glycosyltransferase YjiC (YdhE family)